jgi:hypothetical protein
MDQGCVRLQLRNEPIEKTNMLECRDLLRSSWFINKPSVGIPKFPRYIVETVRGPLLCSRILKCTMYQFIKELAKALVEICL